MAVFVTVSRWTIFWSISRESVAYR